MFVKRFLYSIALIALLASCSTKKNTMVSRTYHNITARYNGYYYSCVNIDDGIYKIERSHKENFEKVLPVFIYPSAEKAKNTFPEFDKAIKKSTFCIQRHTIKDKKNVEVASAGKWIDNNWINIGISQFYKREFFSAIESFEYVTRTYNKSKDKYTAMIWLIKAYNEIGSVSNAEPLISFLKNEKNLPPKIKNELPVVWADYYTRRGQNTEAIARLMEASRNNNFFTGLSKKRRARYSFITAQLLEQNKDDKRAIEFYRKTIKLKPAYEMVFYSKIRMARLLDVKRNNSEKTKKDLLHMAKEFKNSEYYDVIYYTLGEIEMKERNQTQALYYYKRSVQTSVSNPNQKALSFLRLGEINFELANYEPAEAYYDSAVVTLPKEHPDYKQIVARKKTLGALVDHIKTISKEDSLQRIAKMSESELNSYIDKLIQNYQKEEERKQRELDAAKAAAENAPASLGNNQQMAFGNAAVSFPFYNPSVVAFGVSDFVRKWGNRRLEDNWRRSNKTLVAEVPVQGNDSSGNGREKGKNPLASREYYKKNLPFSDSLLAKSNGRIIRAYYMMGSIYKEELNNTKKTISSFEELNNRFPSNKYLLNTYYTLYRIYQDARNQPKADYYKDKILSEFPDSEFALLIKNPNYAEERSSQKSEVENFYNEVYLAYHENNYSQALSQAREGISRFGNNVYRPKMEFIKALSLGKLRGVDSLEQNLKLLVARYPDSEVTPQANEILLAIRKQKNPEAFVVKENKADVVKKDTFQLNLAAPHFIIAVAADDEKMLNEFKTRLNTFNAKYYSDREFNISSNLFGSGKQIVILKSFATAKEAGSYYDNFIRDKDVFKDDVKAQSFTILPILGDNVPYLYKTKNIEGYKHFHDDNYKKLN